MAVNVCRNFSKLLTYTQYQLNVPSNLTQMQEIAKSKYTILSDHPSDMKNHYRRLYQLHVVLANGGSVVVTCIPNKS